MQDDNTDNLAHVVAVLVEEVVVVQGFVEAQLAEKVVNERHLKQDWSVHQSVHRLVKQQSKEMSLHVLNSSKAKDSKMTPNIGRRK